MTVPEALRAPLPRVLRGVAAIDGRRLEHAWITPANPRPRAPTLVFLHEGLGSLAMWKDWPREVVRATGCPAFLYSRAGHGQSDPPAAPRRPDYLHVEACSVLPSLLSAHGIGRPLLVGHSDGASIALIHAGQGFEVAGIVAMAPHVFVEELTLAGIREAVAAWEDGDWRRRLARYHRDPDALFQAWHEVWLAPEFARWNIEALLPAIRAPMVLIQGDDDEYGTIAQVDTIARGAGGPVQSIAISDTGHAPWKDAPRAVVTAILALVQRVAPIR